MEISIGKVSYMSDMYAVTRAIYLSGRKFKYLYTFFYEKFQLADLLSDICQTSGIRDSRSAFNLASILSDI